MANLQLKLVLLFAALLGSFAACAADKAGEVVTVVGRASAATSDGDIRSLQKGHDVNTGDTVVTTTNSFLRMRLTDGAFIVLRPNTRFQIEEYKLADAPAENRGFFNLLKGGFRAVTGLIGQRNHANVQYRTAVATIGIRGTDVEVIDCSDGCPDLGVKPKPGVYFKVHQGGIDVKSGGGNGAFDQGQGGFVDVGGGLPVNLDPTDPTNPINADPTPSADGSDCN